MNISGLCHRSPYSEAYATVTAARTGPTSTSDLWHPAAPTLEFHAVGSRPFRRIDRSVHVDNLICRAEREAVLRSQTPRAAGVGF